MSTEPESPSTGRLFRAASVDDEAHTDAIPAIASPRAQVSDVLPDSAFRGPSDEPASESPLASMPAATAGADAASMEVAVGQPASATHAAPRSQAPGLNTAWTWIVIVGVTLLMSIADVLVRKQGIGWITGVGVLAATVYCAVAARRDVMWWTLIAAPIAVALATVTVGQVGVTRSGSFVISQGLNLLDSLGRVAPFTLAAIIAALAIALIRRSRAA